MEDQLNMFNVPEPQPASNRRRTRRGALCDENIASRRDRINKRNRAIVARYYYWTELERRRFDDTLKILSDNEFFLEDRTISNALIELDDFFNDLCRQQITRHRLRVMFPGFDFA